MHIPLHISTIFTHNNTPQPFLNTITHKHTHNPSTTDYEAAKTAQAAEHLKTIQERQKSVVLSLRPFFRQSGVAVDQRSDWLGMDEGQLQAERAAVEELVAQCKGQLAGVLFCVEEYFVCV